MRTAILDIRRDPALARLHPELKDPDVVRLPASAGGGLMMFASLGRSDHQSWVVGRFLADSIEGPWREVAPARLHGIAGPQLCAPTTICRDGPDGPRWEMHIQTACFEPDGRIVAALSHDGLNFAPAAAPPITRHSIARGAGVVGVYDAGLSTFRHRGRTVECMVFSGYRSIGNGDLYASFREADAPDAAWRPARCILRQEAVPFHNHPDDPDREWGLEGAKIIQLAERCFLLVGVCFLPRGRPGTRQRVFFAASRSPLPPWKMLDLMIEPADGGETGHPDILVQDGTVHVVYQERAGDGAPWHLRRTQLNLGGLTALAQRALAQRALTQRALADRALAQRALADRAQGREADPADTPASPDPETRTAA